MDVQVVLEAAAGLRAMVDTVLELGRDGDRLQSEEQQRYRRLRRDMGLMLLKAKSILETCAVRCTSLVWARRSIRRLATQLTAVVFRVRLRPRLMPKGPPSSGTRKHPYQRADGMAVDVSCGIGGGLQTVWAGALAGDSEGAGGAGSSRRQQAPGDPEAAEAEAA